MPGNPAQLAKMIPVMIVAMLAGPTLACIFLIGVVDGTPGYRELGARLAKWRVGIGWYGVALLAAPLVLTAGLLGLSLRTMEFLPKVFAESNRASLLLMGLAAGSAAGCFEKLGWTGFVIPRLRSRFGTIATGAIVGILWGAWHLPVNVLACSTSSGGISVPAFVGTLLFSLALLPAYRILMVMVWDQTGTLLVAMLMHMSITASNIILGPAATPGMMGPAFNFVLAAMWIVVTLSIAARRDRGRRTQQRVQDRLWGTIFRRDADDRGRQQQQAVSLTKGVSRDSISRYIRSVAAQIC